MERILSVLLGAALVSIFGVAPAAVAASGDYIGVGGDAVANCGAAAVDIEDLVGACQGGHLFDVPSSSSSVDIEIDDDVTDPTGGYFLFTDGDDNRLAEGPFCDSTTQTVPSGATNLTVFVDNGFATLDCGHPGATGTTGSITAVFS